MQIFVQETMYFIRQVVGELQVENDSQVLLKHMMTTLQWISQQ